MGSRPFLVFAAFLMGGCVTEKPKPGLHYQGKPYGAVEPSGKSTGASSALPTGPVASPVYDSTFSSDVEVEVAPLGGVGYDGQVLPLISPDGHFLASEEGQSPTWPTLLAAPGAAMPLATRVAVYDISRNPARITSFVKPLPKGLLLGRACDDAGFLVEAPQVDGSRWIGRVAWLTGDIDWLVKDGRVNAHAVLTPAGGLAWVARDISSDQGTLMLRGADGVETARSGDGSSHLVPVASPEPGVLCSVSQTAAGLELLAWSLGSGPASDAPADRSERLGTVVSRALIAPAVDAALAAYQITAPCPPVLPRRSGRPWQAERVAIFHPGFARMAEFDRASGGFLLLPEHSVAAARTPRVGAEGWFVTVPKGLVFSPDAARAPAEGGQRRPVQNPRVLAGPYVPRATSDAERPLILLGPVPRDPARLQVMVLRFAGPEASEK